MERRLPDGHLFILQVDNGALRGDEAADWATVSNDHHALATTSPTQAGFWLAKWSADYPMATYRILEVEPVGKVHLQAVTA